VTHIQTPVRLKGYLWGKKDMAGPILAIDHVSGHTVCPKIDKDDIKSFSTVPLERNSTGLQGWIQNLEPGYVTVQNGTQIFADSRR